MNNKTIALNVLYVPYNTEELIRACKPKDNKNKASIKKNKHKNQVILLMITNGKKWHYLAVKSLPALLRGITSNHNEDFYCLNCFHSCNTKNKLRKHERVCNKHDNEDNKILKYNHGEKSMKAPAIIYADLQCLLEKMHSCQNNPETILYRKKTKHMPSGYSLFSSCSFNSAELHSKKTNLIVTKVKTVWKGFVKTCMSMQ